MLNDQHGAVAGLQIAAARRSAAGCRADAGRWRLVEDIADARQAAADAGRQAHALQLAARERIARPVEREVVEADFLEKAEAGSDFT